VATEIRSLVGLKKLYKKSPKEVRQHFEHLPSLLDNYPLEVALGYVFHRLELGQNMSLYCGVVKCHRANTTVATRAINSHHMTRRNFGELYKTVFAVDLPAQAREDLKAAEKTRDTIMHGGSASPAGLRNAIGRVLEFATAVNKQLSSSCRLTPFCGYWRGFAGRLEKLDKRTTRFMLKGMGFAIA